MWARGLGTRLMSGLDRDFMCSPGFPAPLPAAQSHVTTSLSTATGGGHVSCVQLSEGFCALGLCGSSPSMTWLTNSLTVTRDGATLIAWFVLVEQLHRHMSADQYLMPAAHEFIKPQHDLCTQCQ